MSTQKQLRYLSLFSGIGGFELGIQRAFDNEYAHIGEKSEQEERTQGRERPADKSGVLLHAGDGTAPLCVGYSEIDKYAIATYERNFNGIDSRPTREKEQEAQLVGNGSDTEGEHTWQPTDNTGGHRNYGDATKINARELPDFDLLVGGFPCQAFSVAGKRLGFDDTRGTLFFDIARILAEKRPRHLVLENVKGLLSHDSGKTFQTIVGVLTDLGYRVEWQVLNSKDFGVPQNRERVFIVGHLGGEPRRKVFPIFGTNRADTYVRTIRAGGAGSTTEKHARDLIQVNQPKHSNDRVYSDGGVSPTLNTMQDGARIRRLTPLECERLQGFPDDWTVGSDTQRYKQCGNAVTVNVVEAVMSKIL